ncbi:hypothetical protein [Enterococcus sp. C76]|uniref:hypothetical protein n=1 Tax=Enterococcus sp. C76 TaxID=3231334 RepID=UPI0034A06BB9
MEQKINKNSLKQEYRYLIINLYCKLCTFFVGKDDLGENRNFQNYEQSNDCS